MKKIVSKQRAVVFLFCASPVTIDKSAEWGPGNLQLAPNGAFLKVHEPEGEDLTITHLVQPNADKTAPIGWVKTSSNMYDKVPIWVDDENPLPVGETVPIQTADGLINYEVKEPAYRCYNDLDGEPNPDDCWAQTEAALKKNYEF